MKSAKEQIDFYNAQRLALSAGKINQVDFSTQKISWTSAVLSDIEKNKAYNINDVKYFVAQYRPFTKLNLLRYNRLNERQYLQSGIFPTNTTKNYCICTSSIGDKKDFCVIITDIIPDLHLNQSTQCFPLYYYEEREDQQLSLFDDANADGNYIRHDAISDWILREVRSRFGGTHSITKEDIFYYVYGLLHSEEYRKRFADDLRKSLPRIPIVEKAKDFTAFVKAGVALAELHLNYDEMLDIRANVAKEEYGIKVFGESDSQDYDFYAVEQLRFRKVRDDKGKLVVDKSAIIYNSHITIENIPLDAYNYVVNGKSAIEWIMERYCVSIDKASGIKNDCNDWAREHEQPRYILHLLLSVIDVSLKTNEIVRGLPRLGLLPQASSDNIISDALSAAIKESGDGKNINVTIINGTQNNYPNASTVINNLNDE